MPSVSGHCSYSGWDTLTSRAFPICRTLKRCLPSLRSRHYSPIGLELANPKKYTVTSVEDFPKTYILGAHDGNAQLFAADKPQLVPHTFRPQRQWKTLFSDPKAMAATTHDKRLLKKRGQTHILRKATARLIPNCCTPLKR